MGRKFYNDCEVTPAEVPESLRVVLEDFVLHLLRDHFGLSSRLGGRNVLHLQIGPAPLLSDWHLVDVQRAGVGADLEFSLEGFHERE